MIKNIFKSLLYTFALLSLSLPLSGQKEMLSVTDPVEASDSPVLSLDSCKQLALKHNREIRMASLGQEKAKATLWAMKTNFLPKLSAQGFMFYSETAYQKDLSIPPFKLGKFMTPEAMGQLNSEIIGQASPMLKPVLEKALPTIGQKLLPAIANHEVKLPSYSLDFQANDCYYGSINLEQPIFMGGKVIAAHAMAKVGTRAALYKRLLKEREVLFATESAFYLYVKAKELQKVAQAYQKTIEEVERLTMNAVKVGMRTKNDELKVKVELSKAELKVEQAKHAVLLAQMNLNQIIGRELTATLNVNYQFEQYKIETSQAQSLDVSAREEYALLREKVELKKQEKRLVRSEFLPHVGVRGSYSYARGGQLNDHLLLDKGGFSAMLTVSVPLFRWGEGFSKIKAARLEQEIAQEELKHFSERMTLELQQKTNIYNEMLLEVKLSERVLEQAKEHKRVMRNRYEAGLEKMIDYMEAETMYSKASADLIISKTKLALAHSALLKAKGGLLN